MDDDDLVSEARSLNGDSEEDNSDPISSEEEDKSDPLNDDEDPYPAGPNIDVTEIVNTFKHVQNVLSGFTKIVEKTGKSRRCVQTHFEKSSRTDCGRGKCKSNAAAGTSERPGSRFNSKYFGQKIIAKLDDRKRNIIRERGFGILLEYDGCSAPKGFVQWIADQVDLDCSDIVLGGKVIPFEPLSVHLFLGIPIGGEDIKEKYTDSMKTSFLKEIKETSLPSIKSFAQKLLGDTLSDDDVFRYFMVIALSTFLCADSNTYPSPQYLGALIDLSKVKEWNWSKFVYEWMFSSITNYRKKQRCTIDGCRYFLAGYYLDFVNFGGPKRLPVDMPRIMCWKGSMIKNYSSIDCVSGNIYGKRPVKSLDYTVYAEMFLPEEACAHFRKTMYKHCHFVPEENLDEMCVIFERHHSRLGFRSPATLVAKVVKYIQDAHVPIGGAADPSTDAQGSKPADNDAPMPSPGHGVVRDVILEAALSSGASDQVVKSVRAPTGQSENGVKEVDVAGGTSDRALKEVNAGVLKGQIVQHIEGQNACAAKSHEGEASATEIIESDGLYVANDDRVFSQTEIISHSSSTPHDSVAIDAKRKTVSCTQSESVAGSIKRKSRSKASEPSSPASVGSMSPRKMSLRNATRVAGAFCAISGVGAKADDPLIVEDTAVQTSKRARKGKSKDTTSSSSIEELALNVSPGVVADTRIDKRNRNTSQSSSAAILSPKSPRGVPKKLGRSPLSRVDDGFNNGQSASTAVPVHSEAATKHLNLHLKEGEKTIAAAGPSLDKLDNAPGKIGEPLSQTNATGSLSGHAPCVLLKNGKDASIGGFDKNVARDVDLSGKAPLKELCVNTMDPVFNSPSLPSFRLDEALDDLGNYIDDPNKRRPVGTSGCRDRVLVGGTTSNASFVAGNVRVEDTVATSNVGTERDENVETDSN